MERVACVAVTKRGGEGEGEGEGEGRKGKSPSPFSLLPYLLSQLAVSFALVLKDIY